MIKWLFTLHNNTFLIARNIRDNNNHRVTGKHSKKNQVSMNLGLLCVVVRMIDVPHWLVYLQTLFQVGSTIWEGYGNFELKPCWKKQVTVNRV